MENYASLKRNTRLLMLGWTILVAISLAWALRSQEKSFSMILHTEATAIHSTNIEYRNWIIQNGGIYVPVSEEVKPSPWLAKVPERDITTPAGHELTLLNSSYVVRLVQENMRRHGSRLVGHIASLRPINPMNAADPWERRALEAFAHGAKEWASYDVMAGGKTYYRLMKPMITEEACLKCHAEDGDKIGDIRGGVSVAIPVDDLLAGEKSEFFSLVAGHGFFWLLGLVGLGLGGKRQLQSMQQLAEEKSKIVLLTDAMAHAIYGLDNDGNCTFINQAGLKSLGYSNADALLGKNIHALAHHTRKNGDPYPYEECPSRIAMREGRASYSENELLWRKDGSSFTAAFWAYPVFKEGVAHGTVVTFLDVTEKLRLKGELRESKSLLSTIVENIPAMIFLKRAADLKFELFNRAGEKMLGHDRSALIGKNDFDLFTQEQAAAFTANDRSVLERRLTLDIPVEAVKTADGSEKWLHTIKTGLYDDEGNPTHLLGISMDISAQKAVEDRLRNSEYRLAEAQRIAHLGHWEHDLIAGRILWSDEVFRIFDIDPAAFGGTYEDFIACIHPEDREGVKSAYEKGIASRTHFQIEHRALDREGKIKHILEKCEISYDERGKPLRALGTVQDVTLIKLAERNLREQQIVLENALEGTLHTASLAVELRDPYTAGHQERVARLASRIAQILGLDEERIRGIRLGAKIHDIGKIGIPAELLAKPTRLSEVEIQLVREHPKMGYDILKDVQFPWPVAQIAYQHHEHVDGSGYPQGLKGEEILLEARIVAVADVVESMATHRPYRPSLGISAAAEEILAHRGTRYDPQVVDACRQVISEGFDFS